jgi:SAM-dependent methyltransferase
MIASVDWYEANSETVAARYEKVRTDAVHGWLLDLLPKTQATILDVGAGSGRDAAWLAEKGHEVVAAEPSPSMRAVANGLHPGDRIH